jgi:arginase family enzyme
MRTTRSSALVGVFGVPGLRSQRLCSPMGFRPGMRMAPTKKRAAADASATRHYQPFANAPGQGYRCVDIQEAVLAARRNAPVQGRFKKGAGTAAYPCFAVLSLGAGDEAVPAPGLRLFESALAPAEAVLNFAAPRNRAWSNSAEVVVSHSHFSTGISL